MALEFYDFGPHKVHKNDVFYTTDLCFAMVNLRPVLPDVLIVPKREVKRFTDLTVEETADLWLTARKIGRQLESYHKATSLTFTIQVRMKSLTAGHSTISASNRFVGYMLVKKDGPQAGQSVPHVHVHILPRKSGDVESNDEICDAIDEEKELKKKLDLDKERKDRSIKERTEEAEEYRKLFS